MPTTQTDLVILVVDGSRPDLASITAMLAGLGHEVTQASSGEAALEVFRQRAPDMVLMDVTMPGMGGHDTVREMRRIMRDEWIPIIFVAGPGHEDDIVRGIEAGGDDYVLKPVHHKLLQAKIDSLHRHSLLFRGMQAQTRLLLDYQARNEEEQRTAQEVMGRLLALEKIKDPLVKLHLQAADIFSGDLIATARTPTGDLYAMLADSTGHGLTAALAAMPVLQTFYAMVAKGFSLGALTAEINRKVGESLPANRFVAAVLIALDANNGRLSVWNGGCPPAVLFNADGTVASLFRSTHLPFGILDQHRFDDEVTHYYYGNNRCQILMCSDGAVDSADPDNMELGMSHFLRAAHTEIGENRLPAMVKMLKRQLADRQAHDDIALILVDCPAESTKTFPIPEQPELMQGEPNSMVAAAVAQEQREPLAKVEWQFALTLTAPQLRQADIVPLLMHVVGQIEFEDASLSGKLFLILSELFNNALDHGLLKLDSILKHDPQGMDRYFEERAARLERLEQGEIKIRLLKIRTAHGPCLKIIISDTGEGFDYSALGDAALNPSMRRHGRGIALVESMSGKLHYDDKGRESQVCIPLLSAEQCASPGSGGKCNPERSVIPISSREAKPRQFEN